MNIFVKNLTKNYQASVLKNISLKEELQLVKEVFGIKVDGIEYLTKYNLQE